MAPCIYDKKFSVGTQFLFGTLMFTAGKDGNLELQVQGSPPRQWALIWGGAPCCPAGPSSMTTSASDDIRTGLNPYAGPYTLAAMTSWGHPIRAPMFRSSGGTRSPTSSGASTDRDSAEDYPEIGGSVCWNPAIEARRISMVGPGRAYSRNNSSKYPTIRGSVSFDARTPSNRVVQTLNPDFNTVQLQTIMESIQCLAPQDSPLAALAQQGNEAAVRIAAAEPSMGNRRGEPTIGNRFDDRAKRTHSEEASSVSDGKRLADGDTRR
jgi:hypothetical protein